MKKPIAVLAILLCLISLLPFMVPKAKADLTTTMTFNTLSQDGDITNADTSYASCWSSSTGTVAGTSTVIVGGQYYYSGFGLYYIWRDFLFFDTNSIPSSATINGAILSLKITEDDSTTDFNVTLQSGLPTYPHSPLASGDFYQIYYSGNGGSRNTSTISGTGYWNITLNTNGKAWIQKGGTTKIALRSSRDINEQAPTGYEYIQYDSYEYGVSSAPKLYVTFTVPSGPGGVCTYIVHGPYYEDGTVPSKLVKCKLVQPNNDTLQFNLLGSGGVPTTETLSLIAPASYLSWNCTNASNMTRIYYLQPTVYFEEIWIYIPDPSQPFFVYQFVVTDFFGMKNPYLETTITVGGQTRIVERKSLNTVGTVSFIMMQWHRYGMRFRCDQGLYTQYFDAETTSSTNLQVLSGAFPVSPVGNELYAYANRQLNNMVRIVYADPTSSTTWLYFKITHKAGFSTVTDYSQNTTGTNSLTYDWTSADNSTDYDVNIQSYIGQTYSWQYTCPAIVSTLNPWSGLLEALGTWPAGVHPELIPGALIILVVLSIFSYQSAGIGCILAWIVTGIMLLMGWFTIGIPTFCFAGFVSFLVALQESKKTEREL